MLKNLFVSSKKEGEKPPRQKDVRVIDSAHIQNDLHMTFSEVLGEFGLKESRESEISVLESELSGFKAANAGLYEKIGRLRSLGLVNTPSVRKNLVELEIKEKQVSDRISSIEASIEKSKRLDGLVKKYALEYPGYKFVDFDSMVKIMKKYDLFMGEAFMYAREIPTDALEVISRFSGTIEKSKQEWVLVETVSIIGRSLQWSFKRKQKTSVPKESPYSGIIVPSDFKDIERQSFECSCFQMVAPLSHFEFPVRSEMDSREIKSPSGLFSELIEVETSIPLVDIDPKTNIISLCANKVNEFVKKQREVLDPIACIKVDGGFVIIRAWDKEAEIPEIQNPLSN